MLSSTKSRRIFNLICVSLALGMMGYGFFLKMENKQAIATKSANQNSEFILQASDTIDNDFLWDENLAGPNN